MANKLYELGLKLSAKLDGSLKGAFNAASRAVASYDRSVNDLRQHQNALDRVLKQRQTTLRAQQAFAQAQKAVQALGAQMKAAKAPSAALRAEYKAAQAAVGSASAALEKQKALLNSLQASTGTAGKSLAQLKARELELAGAVDRARAAQERQRRVQNAVQGVRGAYGNLSGAYASAAGALATGYAFAQALKPGMELEKQISALGATSDLTAEQLAQVQERATLLGRDTVLSADQAAKGIQLFVRAGYDIDSASKAMDAMGHIAVMTGKDFADASAFALQTMKAFGLAASDAGRLSDVLANATRESGLSADQMAEKLSAIGPTMKALGMSFEESAAMVVAMDKMGVDAERLKKTLSVLKAPTETQAKALLKLGVSAVKADGSAKSMIELMADLNGKLKEMPEAARNAQLSQIFGTRDFVTARALMDSVANGTLPDLITNMNKAGTAAQTAGKLTDNLSGDFQGLGSAISYVAIRAFAVMQPYLRAAVQGLGALVTKVGDFIQENPRLAKAAGIAVAAFAGLVAGLLTLKVAAAGLALGFAPLRLLFTVLPGLIGGVATAARVLFTVLLTNPIGIIVSAIAGLIAIGVALYKNWDEIKAYLTGLWQSFAEKFPLMDSIVESTWNGITEKVRAVWDGIKSVFSGVIDFITNVFSGKWSAAWDSIVSAFGTIFGGIVNMVKVPINAVISAINWVLEAINNINFEIPSWVPGLGGEKFGINIPTIPMLAEGGVATQPTLAMIGEGRESEAILPLSRLESLLGQGTGGAQETSVSIVFSPTINIQGGGDSVAALNEALRVSSEQIRREIDNYFRARQRASYA